MEHACLIRFLWQNSCGDGGSKGIGRAICDQLKLSGARVWNWDVTAAQHDGVKFEKVDVTDGKQIDAAISKAVTSIFSRIMQGCWVLQFPSSKWDRKTGAACSMST